MMNEEITKLEKIKKFLEGKFPQWEELRKEGKWREIQRAVDSITDAIGILKTNP